MDSIGGLNLCCSLNQLLPLGRIKLISQETRAGFTRNNPFEVGSDSFKLDLETNVYQLKQLSGKTVVEMFGVTGEEYYSATVSKPSVVIHKNQLAIVTSNHRPKIYGKVARIDYIVGGIVVIYISTAPEFPEGATKV